VQYVTKTANVTDCKGNKKDVDTSAYPFWESWTVAAGSAVTTYADQGDPTDDTFASPSQGDCTKGTITVNKTPSFYENLVLPATFKPTNLPPTGILPTTKTNPNLTGGGNVPKLWLTATWDCCTQGASKKTTITTS